jgi:hypothetical protein
VVMDAVLAADVEAMTTTMAVVADVVVADAIKKHQYYYE